MHNRRWFTRMRWRWGTTVIHSVYWKWVKHCPKCVPMWTQYTP
jgi:hypothetical protein